MNKHIVGFVAAMVLLAPVGASAKDQAPSADWSGTWKLNVAKSKLGANPGKWSETRTYAVDGKKITLDGKGMTSAGKATHISYAGSVDGKAYPFMGSPIGDSIAITMVTPRELKSKVMLRGKPSASAVSYLSADGKRVTLRRHALIGSAPRDVTMVYDKM
ncbi:hypothetical protein [Sphingomonas sp.]|uniref:hypothetical protein n=1 Tax=Sphingomonas sp. TaxID=28214 RepID=UPI00325FDE81